jgi:ABC-type transport system substrate-binding protein
MHVLVARAHAHESNRADAGGGKKTLIFAQPSDADTLDPADITSRDKMNIAHQLFGALYSVSTNGDLEPYLAESSRFSPDGNLVAGNLVARNLVARRNWGFAWFMKFEVSAPSSH